MSKSATVRRTPANSARSPQSITNTLGRTKLPASINSLIEITSATLLNTFFNAFLSARCGVAVTPRILTLGLSSLALSIIRK